MSVEAMELKEEDLVAGKWSLAIQSKVRLGALGD